MLDGAVGRDDHGGVWHGIVATGGAGQHVERRLQGVLHQRVVHEPVGVDLEQVADEVGGPFHAHVAREGELGRHHEQGREQQALVQVCGHQGPVVPEQHGRRTHRGDDEVLGVDLEGGQALSIDVGVGKVPGGDQQDGQHRPAAEAQMQAHDRDRAPQHERGQQQHSRLQGAPGHPELDGGVGAVDGQQVHALEAQGVEQVEPRTPADAHGDEHHEVVAGELHRGGGHRQRRPGDHGGHQLGQHVPQQIAVLTGPPGGQGHEGGRDQGTHCAAGGAATGGCLARASGRSRCGANECRNGFISLAV